MNNIKRGIAVLAVLVIALSSLFAIQTVPLKSAPASTSNITSAAISKVPDYNFTFKAGLSLVPFKNSSTSITYQETDTTTVKSGFLHVAGNTFGLNFGVEFNKLFLNFVFGFAGNAKLNGFGAYNVSIKEIAKTYGGNYKISFFSISAGYATNINLGSLKIKVGLGGVINRGLYSINAGNNKFEATMINYGFNALLDFRYMFSNWGVGLGINPQLTVYNKTSLVKTGITAYPSSDQMTNIAVPISISAIYTL